jgi:DNA-binding response OmpR family regulator
VNVLIVEDEPVLRDGLVDLVRGAGHTPCAVADGLEAARRGIEESFDVVLLDLMIPKLDGIEVCRRLRKARPALPILMLTARGDEEDKVRGLREGADDYVTKPFGARELLARIEALGRRTRLAPADQERLEVDGCSFDLGRCEARRGEAPAISLTPREVGILRWLHRNRARGVSRGELLEKVWGAPATLQTRTVDMTIANLRAKIERDPQEPRIVVSIKGVGYAWGPGASGS